MGHIQIWVRSTKEAKELEKGKLDEEEAAKFQQPVRRIRIRPPSVHICSRNERCQEKNMRKDKTKEANREEKMMVTLLIRIPLDCDSV